MPLPQSTDCSLTQVISLLKGTPASPSSSPLTAPEGAPHSANGETPQPAGGRGAKGRRASNIPGRLSGSWRDLEESISSRATCWRWINYAELKSPMRGNHKSNFHYQMKYEGPQAESTGVDFFFFLRWVRDRWELALYPSTSSLQPSVRFPSHTIP